MTAHRFALRPTLSLAALLVLACDPPIKQPCTIRNDPVVPPATVIGFNHQSTLVEIRLRPPFACQGGNPKATRVDTQLFDPTNAQVAHTATEPTSSDSSGYATDVVFTPSLAGSYYVDARFEPSIGAQHRDVTVAEDRRGELPFLQGVVLPNGCRPTAVTETVVICQLGSTVSIIRPAESQTYRIENVGSMVFAAPALWVWGADRVDRYTLGPTGAPVLSQSVNTAASTVLSTSAASATETVLTLFQGAAVERYTVANTTLTREVIAVAGLDVNRYGLAVRLVSGHFGVHTKNGQVCDVSLDPVVKVTCVAAEGSRPAIDGAGFWVTLNERTGYYRFVDGRPALSSIPFTLTGPPKGNEDQTPYFLVDTAHLIIRPVDFRLDAFKREAGENTSVGVLETVIWGRNDQTNTMRAYRR